MAWTYTPDFTTQRDRVRREIGDVVSTDQQLSDAEIAYAGTVEGTDIGVAARCCEWIAGAYARKADYEEGKLKIWASQRFKAYTAKAKELRALDATAGAIPFIGGESIADKETRNEDTDRVQPAFWRGMLDEQGVQQLSPNDTDIDQDGQ